jgi:periplasmic divalent cation tolerance protein
MREGSMESFIQVVTTTETREAAEQIARALVEKRLAACVQIDGPITSVYRWQGQVEQAQEWRLTAKSRADYFEEIVVAIREILSFDIPEIVATRIDFLDEPYRQWLEAETLPAGGEP